MGLWDAQGDLTKARERIGCGAIVVATLADAQEQIRLLTPPPLPRSEKQAQPERSAMVMTEAYPRSSEYVAAGEPATVDH